jgi:hypothetical protein
MPALPLPPIIKGFPFKEGFLRHSAAAKNAFKSMWAMIFAIRIGKLSRK